MAGGKATKRVNLRAKIAKKQQQQHAHQPGSFADAAASSSFAAAEATQPSASPAAVGHAEEDRQTALQIRDALRQRRGRTGRAPATAAVATDDAPKPVRKVEDRTASRRLSAKKESKKAPAALHPAAQRRAAVQERRRLMLPQLSAAEERMAAAQEELRLFDKVQTVPAYTADPFAAVMQHLAATMDTLKPLTSDVGRVARE